jgi:hypothetical protein
MPVSQVLDLFVHMLQIGSDLGQLIRYKGNVNFQDRVEKLLRMGLL